MEAMLTEVRKMTVAEFRNLEFDEDDSNLYELLDGELVKRSAPATAHQRVSRNIFATLLAHVGQGGLGELFYAPYDVFLDEHNVPQPDLMFVDKASSHLITEIGIEGPPTLLVEVISPTSAFRDRIVKKELYERFGVRLRGRTKCKSRGFG